MGYFLLLRGENRRKMELCDLSFVEYPGQGSPTAHKTLVAVLSAGKTNKDGKKQFMGVMRHKNPVTCTMGAIAQYLFHRFHCSGEAAPDFSSRKSWYRAKLLVVARKSPTSELTYTSHYETNFKALTGAGISSDQITHFERKIGSQAAEKHGVPESQVLSLPPPPPPPSYLSDQLP
jgi:Centromere DNA-binding protein complex CBF3 subunit, domain 2